MIGTSARIGVLNGGGFFLKYEQPTTRAFVFVNEPQPIAQLQAGGGGDNDAELTFLLPSSCYEYKRLGFDWLRSYSANCGRFLRHWVPTNGTIPEYDN